MCSVTDFVLLYECADDEDDALFVLYFNLSTTSNVEEYDGEEDEVLLIVNEDDGTATSTMIK